MPSTQEPPINDTNESDADGDDAVDWSRVDELAGRYAEIDAIEDDGERLAAAKALAAEMAGGA